MILRRDQRFSPDSLFYQKWIWTMLSYMEKVSFHLIYINREICDEKLPTFKPP